VRKTIPTYLRLATGIAAIVLLTSCASKEKESPAAEEDPLGGVSAAPMKLPVGPVHFVHPDGEFVLIRSGSRMAIQEGQEITTYAPDGRPSARLTVSPARKGPFLVADIVEGVPSVGDQALVVHSLQRELAGSSDENEVQVLE